MSFTFSTRPDEPITVSEAVGQALGAASMCWSETPSGVFDSERATEIYKALEKVITTEASWSEPHLGQDSATIGRTHIPDQGRLLRGWRWPRLQHGQGSPGWPGLDRDRVEAYIGADRLLIGTRATPAGPGVVTTGPHERGAPAGLQGTPPVQRARHGTRAGRRQGGHRVSRATPGWWGGTPTRLTRWPRSATACLYSVTPGRPVPRIREGSRVRLRVRARTDRGPTRMTYLSVPVTRTWEPARGDAARRTGDMPPADEAASCARRTDRQD